MTISVEHNRMAAFLAVALMVLGVSAIPMNHVPETSEGVRPISVAATEANHLLVVNAGGIPATDWSVVATYALSRICINTWTNSVEAAWLDGLIVSANAVTERFGTKAKVGVFVCDRPGAPREVACVGAWCVVNVWGYDGDSPSQQTLRDRWAKAILRGVARAGGAMETANPECSFYSGVKVPADMDRTRIMLAPEAYFPALARFRAIGGHEMTILRR